MVTGGYPQEVVTNETKPGEFNLAEKLNKLQLS
jgi:hypothetical protein